MPLFSRLAMWVMAISLVIAIAWFSTYYLILWLWPQASAPDCPYIADQSPPRNAGCLLLQEQRVLLIAHAMSGKWDFPGGTHNSNEVPRCTAFRETFEETGLVLNVEESLYVAANDYELFRCTSEPISDELLRRKSTVYNIERDQIRFIKIEDIQPEDLRYPNEYSYIVQEAER